jgi:polyisoprenoid-binding protein YceI
MSIFISVSTSARASCNLRRIVDSETGHLKWTGRKLTGSHHGLIKEFAGYILFDGEMPCSGEITLKMRSIKNTDISNRFWREKLEEHLKSRDFFNVDKFPLAFFRLSSCQPSIKSNSAPPTPNEGTLWRCFGSLTVKGISKDLEVETLRVGDTVTGQAELRRSDYGILYQPAQAVTSQLANQVILENIQIPFTLKLN